MEREGRHALLPYQRQQRRLREPHRQWPHVCRHDRPDRPVRYARGGALGHRRFVYHGSRLPQLRGRYVFAEFSRIFNFPSGPHNYGRLLYLAEKKTSGDKLLNIKEFNGLDDAIAAIGLTVPPAACNGLFPPTLAMLGMGQDAQGELYAMGNISGLPFGTGGVVVRLAPPRNKK